MSNKPFILALLYSFFLLADSVYGIGEKTITIGSVSTWQLVEKKQGITEVSSIRPNPVLVLAGRGTGYDPLGAGNTDLYLSFDEGRAGSFNDSIGHYEVSVSPELGSVSAPLSRLGTGAAMFSEKSVLSTIAAPLVLKPNRNALFAPGSNMRDFSIEFWLFPLNLDTGEQIFTLTSSKPDGNGGYYNQRIQCVVLGNKLTWTFTDIFFSPGERNRMPLSFSGPVLLNKTWSHHLVRFDADIGLLEYLVDGRLEALSYATSTGRELSPNRQGEVSRAGGEVYTPVIGENCSLMLGSRFTGLMDEFKIHRHYVEKASLSRYSETDGRIETRTLDLGNSHTSLLTIEAFGGRTGMSQNLDARIRNEYAGNASLRFSDHAEIKFFIRVNNSPYNWLDIPWMPFVPGTDLSAFRGRYIQIAADFYPSGDGETSPYLSELKIIYSPAEPPPPPAYITAAAKDGAVELSWRASPSRDVAGYFIYYGTAKGEYFESRSPIDAGNRTSITIEGLNNGILYYFVVAAYNMPETLEHYSVPEPGNFSREVAARPLRM